MKKGTKYKQIQYEERCVIEKMHIAKKSIREISRVLNRSVSSISYELKRNKVNNEYVSIKAKIKSYQTRYRAKEQCLKLGIDTHLAQRVEEKLSLKWSPNQISGYLKLQGIVCSDKAIYKYVRSRCLESKLMFKGKPRKVKWRYVKAKIDKEKRNIKDRILSNEVGHYEMDFIVSKHNSYSLLVLVEKRTKYSMFRLISNRKQITVLNALRDMLKDKKVLSITTDNDISFSNWRYLEKVFKTKIYFTDPYSSWQKGLVENTNRWIRLFLPKKTDFKLIKNFQLEEINIYLNKKPRKILGFFSAYELYFRQQECSR
jgi:IS30 family transposase